MLVTYFVLKNYTVLGSHVVSYPGIYNETEESLQYVQVNVFEHLLEMDL